MGWGELKAGFPGKLSPRVRGEQGQMRGAGPGQHGALLPGGCPPACVCPLGGGSSERGHAPCLNHQTLFLLSWLQTCRHSCSALACGETDSCVLYLLITRGRAGSWCASLGHRCPRMIQLYPQPAPGCLRSPEASRVPW